MSKFKSMRQESFFEEDDVYVKNNKRSKSSQYKKCKNYECEENNNGFCSRYKNRAKEVCKKFV